MIGPKWIYYGFGRHLKENLTKFQFKGPPGEPDLKVFVDNEPSGRSDSQLVLRAGQHIELRCTARGGNPIPSLTFTKNGQSFGSKPQAYENTYNYVVTPEDHDAVLGCTAQNQADRRADSPEIKLNVLCEYIKLNIACACFKTYMYRVG